MWLAVTLGSVPRLNHFQSLHQIVERLFVRSRNKLKFTNEVPIQSKQGVEVIVEVGSNGRKVKLGHVTASPFIDHFLVLWTEQGADGEAQRDISRQVSHVLGTFIDIVGKPIDVVDEIAYAHWCIILMDVDLTDAITHRTVRGYIGCSGSKIKGDNHLKILGWLVGGKGASRAEVPHHNHYSRFTREKQTFCSLIVM